MTSKQSVIQKNVTHGTELYLCVRCAEGAGGKWPKGHAATWSGSVCDVCQKQANTCALSDWEWPKSWPNRLRREF